MSDKIHSDDMAVDRFAAAMKDKLAKKREQGYAGWDSEECQIESLAQMLVDHVNKGDPIDIANFSMMIHQRESDFDIRRLLVKQAFIGKINEVMAACFPKTQTSELLRMLKNITFHFNMTRMLMNEETGRAAKVLIAEAESVIRNVEKQI